ncbi:hypothetical protein H9643_18950 [Ochrobactrum sp. Sa2BUA5]|nr:hypothetical protein [Ochrobactrum gallinarum]
MIYARSNTVESNPRYQAAVAEQRRREQAKAEARKRAEIAKQSKPVVFKSAEQIAEQRRERDRRMFEEAAQKFPIEAPEEDVSIRGIIQRVADEYGVHIKDIMSGKRSRKIIAAKYDAIHRVWIEKDPIGLSEIGRRFGGMDHTTILHALRKKGVTDTRQRASKSAEVQHE